jgi:hypothetical protein
MMDSVQQWVDRFATSPFFARRGLCDLLSLDRTRFCREAVQLLLADSDSPGHHFLLTLMLQEDVLIPLLADPGALTPEQAVALARRAQRIEPMLDVLLARRMGGNGSSPPPELQERLLHVISAISGGLRVLPILTQLARHPNLRIRSKAALMLGRAHRSARWLAAQLAEPDRRIRANSVEALWGMHSPELRPLLWQAAKDKESRVAANALVGLYLADETACLAQFRAMAAHKLPGFRASAAWAMGKVLDPRFLPDLDALLADPYPRVRANAQQSRRAIMEYTAALEVAGPVTVHIQRATIRPSQCRELRVFVSGREGTFLAGLPAVGFFLTEGGREPVAYEVEQVPSPEHLALVFLLPVWTDLADRVGAIGRPLVAECIPAKRSADAWSIVRFRPQGEAAGAPENLSALSTNPNLALAETAHPRASRDSSAGLGAVLQSVLPRLSAVRAVRHVLLLLDPAARLVLDAGQFTSLMAAYRQNGIALHVLSLEGVSDGIQALLAQFSEHTGGLMETNLPAESAPAAAARLYRSLLGHYRLRYRFEQPEPLGPVRLQITAREGAGLVRAHLLSGPAAGVPELPLTPLHA